ncbi:uncharacterized protein LOC143023660 [Oratosquilla oratoria]|uniref:uncharacterized protein LOC143023660 n=1 Tax=Oratosquilla oratoria TaxID=337810 RepID=UPI003F7746B3
MSANLQEAKKKRASAKGWVSRSVKELEDLLNDDATSLELLEATICTFDKRLADLEKHQTAMELELNSDEVESDMDETDKFQRSARKIRAKAAKRLKDMTVVNDSISVSSKDRSEVRLPSLELPKYAGEAIVWQPFWDRFEALVDQSDLPVIGKFSYLQSLLRGEALSLIQGLALTAANYKIACDLLKERFGSTEIIVFTHVSGLMYASLTSRAKGANQCDSLWKLRDQLLRHIRSLEAIGFSGNQYGMVLTPIIVARLPQDIRLEWSMESAGREGDLDWLMKFLQTEIQRRERSEIFKDLSMEKSNAPQDVERRKVSSASALHTSAEEGPQQCVFCQKRHKSEKCNQILRLDILRREEKVKSLGLCFKCLVKGHMSKDCRGKVKCAQCSGYHNVLFCRTGKTICVTNNSPSRQGVAHTPSEQVNNAVNTGSGTVEHVGISHDQRVKRSTVLQTAKIKTLTNNGKSIDAFVMFDLGADTTYVSHDIVRRIKPKWVTSKYTSYSTFGNKKSQNRKERNIYDVKVIDTQGNPHSILAVEVETICPPLSRQRIPSDVLQSLSHLQLADDYGHDGDLTLDILIGVDNYWRFVSPENLIRCDDLVAFESVFGWILSGSCMKTQEENVSHQMLCMSTAKPVNESELHGFWSLESIGICAGRDKSPKDPVLDNFENSVKFVDGRYEAALPWKSEVSKLSLLENETGARKRLATLNSKFERNPSLRIEYD